MLRSENIKIYEENSVISNPTLFIVNEGSNTCVIVEDKNMNPCDYIEKLFENLKALKLNKGTIYIDLKQFYGNYSDDWLWKCTFIMDESGMLENVEYKSVMDTELDNGDNACLREYIYNRTSNEIALCVS